jgi:hypothetical protein
MLQKNGGFRKNIWRKLISKLDCKNSEVHMSICQFFNPVFAMITQKANETIGGM